MFSDNSNNNNNSSSSRSSSSNDNNKDNDRYSLCLKKYILVGKNAKALIKKRENTKESILYFTG